MVSKIEGFWLKKYVHGFYDSYRIVGFCKTVISHILQGNILCKTNDFLRIIFCLKFN